VSSLDNPIKKLLGQTAIYGFTLILGRMLNFLLVPLYVSVFADPKDYGVVSILYAWVAFLIVLLPLGMETAFFKFVNDPRNDKNTIFQNSLLTIILFNGVVWLVAVCYSSSIASWMLLHGHSDYVILLASIVYIDAISALPMAKLRSENKAKRFATIQITSIAVNISVNLLLLLFFFDNNNPSQGIRYILIANLLSSLVKMLFVYRDLLTIRFNLNIELTKQMLWYSLPLVIAGFAGIINETIDRILLNRILYNTHLAENNFLIDAQHNALSYAQQQVGIYSANYKLAMIVTIFLQAYRYAAEPFFFSNAKGNSKTKLYAKVMNYLVAVLCVAFLFVSLNVQYFKYFIPNSAYWEGLRAVPLLLLANVFLGIYFNQSIWYKLSGQTKFGAFIAIGGASLTIGLNILLIPKYGYMASAWATMIVYGSQTLASYLLGQKFYPIYYNLRKFGLYFGLALFIFFLCKFLDIQEGFVQFAVHNTFIFLFLSVVYFIEKDTIKR